MSVELWASPYSEEAVELAKKYINDNGYTSENVKLVRREHMLMVVER